MVNKQSLNELALFAGAGGGILGGKLLGWRTVCAVEWESYPASVLVARQNDGLLEPFPVWDDVQTFDGKPWRGIVDVVSGGFPCQDISAAGKGAGITGERSGMWKEMARIISEVRPAYVFVENSPMLTTRGLGVVLGDLASMGFDAEWGVLGAYDVGANHKRERIWIVANSKHSGYSKKVGGVNEKTHGTPQENWQKWSGCGMPFGASGVVGKGSSDWLHNERNMADTQIRTTSTIHNQPGSEGQIPNADSAQCQGVQCSQRTDQEYAYASDSRWWTAEPNVGRVVDGVASRVDRLKAIGNGQVPLCAATAWNELIKRF